MGASILVDGVKYKVVGLLKEKGASSGFGGDRNILIPLPVVRQQYSNKRETFIVNVLVNGPQYLDAAIEEARGTFRIVRGLPLQDQDDFDIRRSDNLATMLIENMSVVSFIGIAIGGITLLGAAIGLMNIMLVSVTERTREIGTRKALGARQSTIKWQFLAEAVVICQIGGLLGLIMGVFAGNIVSFIIGSGFIVPWIWIIMGISLCMVVGIIAGYYPAMKAARLDPIEALRYE